MSYFLFLFSHTFSNRFFTMHINSINELHIRAIYCFCEAFTRLSKFMFDAFLKCFRRKGTICVSIAISEKFYITVHATLTGKWSATWRQPRRVTRAATAAHNLPAKCSITLLRLQTTRLSPLLTYTRSSVTKLTFGRSPAFRLPRCCNFRLKFSCGFNGNKDEYESN